MLNSISTILPQFAACKLRYRLENRSFTKRNYRHKRKAIWSGIPGLLFQRSLMNVEWSFTGQVLPMFLSPGYLRLFSHASSIIRSYIILSVDRESNRFWTVVSLNYFSHVNTYYVRWLFLKSEVSQLIYSIRLCIAAGHVTKCVNIVEIVNKNEYSLAFYFFKRVR